jgi:hypothetical protein
MGAKAFGVVTFGDAPFSPALLRAITRASTEEPPAPQRGIAWRIAGASGGGAFGGSLLFWTSIYSLSKIPTTGPQPRNDAPVLTGLSAAGALLGGFGGYWLGWAADGGSIPARIGVAALDVLGGFSALVTLWAIIGGFFSMR